MRSSSIWAGKKMGATATAHRVTPECDMGSGPAPPCQIRPRSGAFQHCQRKQRHNDLMTAVADETRSPYPVIIVLSDSAAALRTCWPTWDDDSAVLLCTSVGMNGCFGCCCSSRPLAESFRRSWGEWLTLTSGRTSCRSVFASSGRVGPLHPSIRPCYPSIPLPSRPTLPSSRPCLVDCLLAPLVVAWLSECPYSYSEVVCRIIQRRPSRRLRRRFAFQRARLVPRHRGIAALPIVAAARLTRPPPCRSPPSLLLSGQVWAPSPLPRSLSTLGNTAEVRASF